MSHTSFCNHHIPSLLPHQASVPTRLGYRRPPLVQDALDLLAIHVSEGNMLSSPDAVRDYLRLLLADRPHEVFCVVFLDAQHDVLAMVEMFRGTLTQTSVYPREVVVEALARNAAAVVLAHNHPSGHTEPSPADLAVTQALKQALALVDVRVLDHFVITRKGLVSFAERGLL
jgi:DNA repair protein RadC